MTRHLHTARDGDSRRLRHHRQLRTLVASVRTVELTPLGHVSCVLDSPAGRLRALSDAAAVHLPELRPGTRVQVVLLQFHRATADAQWHWQLLCCRAVPDDVVSVEVDASHTVNHGGAQ